MGSDDDHRDTHVLDRLYPDCSYFVGVQRVRISFCEPSRIETPVKRGPTNFASIIGLTAHRLTRHNGPWSIKQCVVKTTTQLYVLGYLVVNHIIADIIVRFGISQSMWWS